MSADTLDHMHRLDERTLYVPDATPEQWAAATRYVTRNASDLLEMLGMTA